LPDGHPQNQNRPPAIRSGVSAERRHLKKSGKVCGSLPARCYGKGESFAVSLKIRATGLRRSRRSQDDYFPQPRIHYTGIEVVPVKAMADEMSSGA
jgi:hypothetical protein